MCAVGSRMLSTPWEKLGAIKGDNKPPEMGEICCIPKYNFALLKDNSGKCKNSIGTWIFKDDLIANQ